MNNKFFDNSNADSERLKTYFKLLSEQKPLTREQLIRWMHSNLLLINK